jgi:hypothetical protein
MPRNRYTPTIRRVERTRAAHQEAALSGLARELHGGCQLAVTAPVANPAKAQRSARLEQTRLHRLRRVEAAARA